VEGELRYDRLSEDAKQLIRVAYERRGVDGVEQMQADLAEAAEHRSLAPLGSTAVDTSRLPHAQSCGTLLVTIPSRSTRLGT
jgi:hypothetical protein